jgi:hypothetical protein
VAKRVRGSRSAHRPGGQGPNRTKRTSETAPLAADDLELAGAGESVTDADYIEVEVDEEAVAALAAVTPAPAAEAEAQPQPTRSPRRARRSSRKQRSGDLATRAASEDVWVRADLRRIGLVSVVLLVALAACWFVFGFLDVLDLY